MRHKLGHTQRELANTGRFSAGANISSSQRFSVRGRTKTSVIVSVALQTNIRHNTQTKLHWLSLEFTRKIKEKRNIWYWKKLFQRQKKVPRWQLMFQQTTDVETHYVTLGSIFNLIVLTLCLRQKKHFVLTKNTRHIILKSRQKHLDVWNHPVKNIQWCHAYKCSNAGSKCSCLYGSLVISKLCWLTHLSICSRHVIATGPKWTRFPNVRMREIWPHPHCHPSISTPSLYFSVFSHTELGWGSINCTSVQHKKHKKILHASLKKKHPASLEHMV